MTAYASSTPAAAMYGIISRRVKLPPSVRLERRRARNRKARVALMRRRWAKGLRGDGKPRKRPWRETVTVLQVAPAKEGRWIRIGGFREIEKGTRMTLVFSEPTNRKGK